MLQRGFWSRAGARRSQGRSLIFHRPGGNTVGTVEEVGIVGRPAADEQEVLLWAFQGRNGRLGIVLQMLQLRVGEPCAAGIPRHAARTQSGLQRDAAVAMQPGLGVLFAHTGLRQDDGAGRAEDDGVVGARVGNPPAGVTDLGGLPPSDPAASASIAIEHHRGDIVQGILGSP